MATNLGYYIEKDSGMGSTPRLKNFKKTNKGNVAELDFSNEGDVITSSGIPDTSFKQLTPNDGGATGNGMPDMPLLDLNVIPDSTVTPGGKETTKGSNPGFGVANTAQGAAIKAGLGIIQGYMKSDAIRSKANYEADILQLSADNTLSAAMEQQGVDFTKIIRYGEQVDEVVTDLRAEFTKLDQEGGASEDLIAENTLQGRLNQMAMMNEAQAKVAGAEFNKKMSYLKAKQMRDISKKQGQQAINAGYLETALAFI